MKALHKLTDLQVTLLDTIWRREEATVREVFEAQRDSLGLALKTVGTVLRRLEDQGILTHRRESRQFVYSPRVSRDEVREASLRATSEHHFSGSTTELILFLLARNGVSPGGREAIRRALKNGD